MKQKLRVFLTLLLCAVASVGWAEEVSIKYIFTTKDWKAKIDGTVPQVSEDWTSGKAGNSYQSNQGVQVTTGVSGANATSPKSYTNISKITVEYCTNASNGVGTISVKVGEGTAKSFSVTKPSSGGTTLKNAEFTYDPTETGKVNIAVTCTTNSIYIHAITITYDEGGAPSPSLSVNPASLAFGEKAINSTYTETFTVTYANLTEDLSVRVGSGLTGVTVSPTTISKDATSPQTVTVTFAPTTVGSIDGEITVSNTDDNVSRNVAVTGSAYDPTDASSYVLYTDEIEEGDYVIYSSDGAMKNEVVSNRFANQSVIPENNKIVNPANTIVWHIAKNGEYWTIYNAAIGKYAAGTDTKNQGSLVDEVTDLAKWTITVSNGTWSFENYGRSEGSDPGNKYLRQNSTSGWACYLSGTGHAPTLYKFDDGSPSISADDVELAYNATEGSIEYTIDNPVEGTTLNVLTTATWLTLGEVGESSIPFTCSANETTEPRTAIVSLTYGEVTETVTVTQAAAPVVYTTIPNIFAAAKNAGTTATNVNVTFGNWVVSGVNGSNAYVTDNNGNGFIIYKSDHGFTVNDKLSGTVFETPLKLYNGSAEFTNLTKSATGLDVTNDGAITVITDKTIADLGGVNTGAVITLSNLTYDGTVLSDGTNTIKPYNSLYSEMSFTSGKIYNVTGVYLNFGSTKEILPRSAADIEEVVNDDPVISAENVTLAYDATEGEITYTIGNVVEGGELTASVTSGDWLILGEIGASPITFTCEANTGAERTATVTLTYTYNTNETVTKDVSITQAAYVAPITGVKYVKVTSTNDITDGQYLIVYEEGSVAFNGGLETLDAASNTIEVTIDNNEIAATEGTTAAEFAIASIEEGYSVKSSSGYYVGNTSDTNALKSSTTVKYTNAINIVDGDADIVSSDTHLRFNAASGSERFRYFKSSTYTNQKAIQLYKKVNDTPETESVTVGSAGYTTYVTKNNVAIPEGVEVYIVTTINESSIHMDRVTGAIPANTPIVVKASADTYELTATDDETADVSDNLLLGSDGTIKGDGSTIYALGVGKTGNAEGKVGFYHVKAGSKVPEGKAYLKTTSGAKDYLAFDFGETDGIGQIEIGQTSNVGIYNLSGQRVNKAQKGIYIVNGKKIVIR